MEEDEAQEVDQLIKGYEHEIRNKNSQLNQANEALLSSSAYSGESNNLIEFQLELDATKERIENLLRGKEVKSDGQGNIRFVTPKDQKLITLNDYGVQLIMRTVEMYVNRNTLLACYDEERIKEILLAFSEELIDTVYYNYPEMGMTTIQKRSQYNLLVLSIVNLVESTYRRAYKGLERDSLRSARIVTQNENPSILNMNNNRNKQGFKITDPKTW